MESRWTGSGSLLLLSRLLDLDSIYLHRLMDMMK